MQPQTPPKPVMDVTAPARPAPGTPDGVTAPQPPLPVREAPDDTATPHHPHPAPATPLATKNHKPEPNSQPEPSADRRTDQLAYEHTTSGIAGVVTLTIACMLVLAGLAVYIYLKSTPMQ